MITMEYVKSKCRPFCDQKSKEVNVKHYPCCYKQSTITDNGANICQSCGTVNGFQIAKENMNFYKNQYKIVKKSIYEREYHLQNTINDICNKYKLYISSHNKTKIHLIFKEIHKMPPQINSNGKRMININFNLNVIISK